MSDPTRVEIDLPTVVLNRYGNLEVSSRKSVADLLSPFFEHGAVITLHLVAESTGAVRGFCTFEDPTSNYHSVCGHTLDSSGACWLEGEHEKKRVRQLELIEADKTEAESE